MLRSKTPQESSHHYRTLRKESNPTMESPSKEEKVALDALHHQFNDLVQHWDTINQSNPKTLHRLSSTGSLTVIKELQLLDSSPRSLMSFLQYTPSPPSERNGGGWKVRNNDLAVEEILSERRAAVRSGKLKGRRLFPVADGVSDNMCPVGRNEIACSGLSSIGGESEERSLWSYDYSDDENENVETKKGFSPVCLHCAAASTYSSLSSSPPSSISYDKVVVEEKEMVDVETVEEKKRRAETGPCESRTQEKVFMAWLGILLTLFAVGFITARTLRGYGYGDEVTPIPT